MIKSKKSISKFLNSEEGKILNSDVVKMGITLGIAGAVMATETETVLAVSKHANYFRGNSSTGHLNYSGYLTAESGQSVHFSFNETGSRANAHYSHNAHGSHGSHGSHSSHGSHARGGWC